MAALGTLTVSGAADGLLPLLVLHGLPLGMLCEARRARPTLGLAVDVSVVPGQVLAADVRAEVAGALLMTVHVPWLLKPGRPFVVPLVFFQRPLRQVLAFRMNITAVGWCFHHDKVSCLILLMIEIVIWINIFARLRCPGSRRLI